MEWLKKRLSSSVHERRLVVEPEHPALSVVRQTELLGIDRRGVYYRPVVSPQRLDLDKLHMNAIDELYTKYPFYGSRRMVVELHYEYGIDICRERVRHLMRKLGLQATYPKPNTSKAAPMNATYPYLLRGLPIIRSNQVVGSDITYIRTTEGYIYLVAFIDWFSHFTAHEFINRLKAKDVRISMDGRGRALDNIFTERLWRTVKYEDVYLNSYRGLTEAQAGLDKYFRFYNDRRRHQALDYRTPQEVYFQ